MENDKKKEVVEEMYTAIERNGFSSNTGFVIDDHSNDEATSVADRGVFRDKLGRLHFNRYMAGPVKLVLRAVRFSPHK